jgi:mono/diheme cytochrome c family protein
MAVSTFPRLSVVLIACLLASALRVAAQNPEPVIEKPARNLKTGEEIYRAACVGCHGPHGEGMPKSTVGFDAPSTFPDFTKCDQTAPEYNRDYKAVIRDGGPARGFSQIMPSFSDSLTSEQMDQVIGTLRSFCADRTWSRGELNFPRSLVTEKAYLESETVLTTTINVQGAPAISNEFVYEQRFGKKNQLEITVPFSVLRQDPGKWFGGIGDIAAGIKHLLYSSLPAGSILSVQGEVIMPTGNKNKGTGTGVTTFSTFAMFDQRLSAHSFLQVQGGADLPTHPENSPQSVFLRTAIGQSFSQGMGLGRQWTPMFELITTRDLQTGARTNFDVVPQFQVTINRRQHVRANLGVSIPVNNTAGRPIQLMVYVLWDWFDGGLFQGWR